MRSNVILSLLLIALIVLTPVSSAQENSAPGTQVRTLLVNELDNGANIQDAANQVSQTVINEGLYFDAAGTAYLSDNQDSFESLVEKYKETGRSSLLLKIQRGEETSWVTIKFVDN